MLDVLVTTFMEFPTFLILVNIVWSKSLEMIFFAFHYEDTHDKYFCFNPMYQIRIKMETVNVLLYSFSVIIFIEEVRTFSILLHW